MKKILILGAGKSSPYLISYLINRAEENNWFVTVGDLDKDLAQSRISNNPNAKAIFFDVNNTELRTQHIKDSDMVINILAPRFQHMIALACVHYGKHMISVSYQDKRIRELDRDARKKGILILTEIGLDPGIDHMSAALLVDNIRSKGGIIKVFQSYGGGLPAPDSIDNPFKYVISWNPRNVVMAGEKGAQYLENGNIVLIPFHNVFRHTWSVEVPGLGMMEAYPNRDSLYYQQQYGFEDADTVIRGTLRYPGWSETWYHIIRLGLPNENLIIPNLSERTYAELTEMFLPPEIGGGDLKHQVANYLNINPTGTIIEKLQWLGLFSDEKIGEKVETSAEVLTQLIEKKLALNDDACDMVVLQHKLVAEYNNTKKEQIISTMISYGEKAGFSSMAKSVGLPAAIVAKLLLQNKLPLKGCHIPTNPVIYQPVLKELEEAGFRFNEQITSL
ncbi:MAG: saccharopine dehydrogenase NADP-binding domain-containing protein [Calditrichaceae bacterium]|nr:saccharopine dehydrogenase NADP-binding domain-containing protein [Calditrichaceae bacterium]